MSDYLQVVTTTASHEMAQSIARVLVQRRLAACVQVSGPIDSVYRWQNQIESSQEWVCSAKTRADRFDEVERAIRELHSYDTPEIIAVPIVAGSTDYLAWVDAQVRP
jgi:periplasmic divalent cation tolerance protein